VNKLVYIEEYIDAYTAISREKQIKNLLRSKKIRLIEKVNPSYEESVRWIIVAIIKLI